jgi:hypothetical protein
MGLDMKSKRTICNEIFRRYQKAGKLGGGGTKIYNLKNEGVDYTTTGDHIPADILREVEALKADIIAGKIKAPATADEINALYPGRYKLLATQKKLTAKAGTFTIVNVIEEVNEVFTVTGLDEVFDIVK